jgi:hypothetical protein
MSFLGRLHKAFEGPPHVSDTVDYQSEVADDLSEEWPVAAEDQAGVDRRNAVSVNRLVPQDPSDPAWLSPPGSPSGGRRYTPRPDITSLEDAQTAHDDAEPDGPHGYLPMWRDNLARLVAIALCVGLFIGVVLLLRGRG